MREGSVKIGPEFFQKIKADYRNWQAAFVREIFQNSIDCGSDSITVTIQPEGSDTRVTVHNDGRPMSTDELLNKLLSLGGSTKDLTTTVGGMGVAKSLLYFCHKSYQIKTGSHLIQGSGANYTHIDQPEALRGTESDVLMAGNEVEVLTQQVKLFTAYSQWDGEVTLNGQPLATSLRKGSPRKHLDWGVVYTNKTYRNILLVRVQGMFMFSRWVDYDKGCVLVELPDSTRLQANRDGLRGDAQNELDEFLQAIAVDKRTAFKERKQEIIQTTRKRYPGPKIVGARPEPKEAEELAAAVAALVMDGAKEPETKEEQAKLQALDPVDALWYNVDFYVKNTTGMTIPDYYKPDGFSDYAKSLAEKWAGCLKAIAKILKCPMPFSVGFIFDEDELAEHEATSEHGHVLYVNPVNIIAKEGKPRVMQRAWSFAPAGRWQLVAIAAHEMVHFVYGLGQHTEDYASKLTEVMGIVLKERKLLARVFDKGTKN